MALNRGGLQHQNFWNSLPDSHRTIGPFKAFKNSIRKLDLSGLL